VDIIGTWHYTGDPAASNKDAIRFLVGDVDPADRLISDEEITWARTQSSNNYSAAALCARRIAARFASQADQTVSGAEGRSITHALSQRSRAFFVLADQLGAQSAIKGSVTPYAGGISVDDKSTQEDDSDRVAPAFSVNQFDHKAAR